MRFTNRQRLLRKAEFEKVRHSSWYKECGPFLLQVLCYIDAERMPVRRVGVITTKRLGNAVVRNRCRRRLRELFRCHQHIFPHNCDVVMIARRGILNSSHTACVNALQQALTGLDRAIDSNRV